MGKRHGLQSAFQLFCWGRVKNSTSTEKPTLNKDSATDPAIDTLLLEMRSLWTESDALWEESHEQAEFGGFVSADYVEVYQALLELKDQVTTVLEWGSGLGVVAIMASRLGFESYGIEVEPGLVQHAEQLAEQYGPDTQFAAGSFIPDDYQWNIELPGTCTRSETDSRAAYHELDMQLHDFDLVYAYPWPDEHGLYLDILRNHSGENTLFLSYDAREGVSLTRIN